MTDGENFLKLFEVFLIDEAHELRKSTIIILAIIRNHIAKWLKQNGPGKPGGGARRYSGPRLIVTSATLETEVFKKYFEGLDCGFIEAKAPTHQVEVTYTQFPDLSTSVVENTAAHLRFIFEVSPP